MNSEDTGTPPHKSRQVQQPSFTKRRTGNGYQ